MRFSKILGAGMHVPARVWSNQDLAEIMDTSDEWIRTRTGIEQRHWVDQDTSECTSDLALKACQRALEKAQVRAEEIDLLILATLSPDYEFPGTACILQAKLGLAGIPALDVRQQCSGFIYSLSIADQFLKTGMYRKVLVVGAETHSKGLDKSTEGRDVSVLFGDGAGAVVLGSEDVAQRSRDVSQIYSTHLHADGNFAKELWIQEPSMARPGDRAKVPTELTRAAYPAMNGKTVFMHAVKRMPEVLMESLAANDFRLEDVDLFLFHQANLRINEMVAKQLGISEQKVFNTIQKYGNTTAATIPIGMVEAERAGKLKKGMLVASAAFGSGFTWASALYRW